MYVLFDEGLRQLEITPALADKIKVSWVPKFNRESLLQRKLPNIKVPNSVSESKYCTVTLTDGSGLEFGFTVR